MILKTSDFSHSHSQSNLGKEESGEDTRDEVDAVVVQDLLPGDRDNIVSIDLDNLPSVDILTRKLKAERKKLLVQISVVISYHLAPRMLSRMDPKSPPIPATRMMEAWLGARLRSALEADRMMPT